MIFLTKAMSAKFNKIYIKILKKIYDFFLTKAISAECAHSPKINRPIYLPLIRDDVYHQYF